MWVALLWKFRTPLICLAAVVALAIGVRVWISYHDTALLSGYVQQAELTAANARTNEMRRQASAAQAALDEYQRKLADAQARSAADTQRLEQEIQDYERTIGADERCTVNPADRDWLLGNSK